MRKRTTLIVSLLVEHDDTWSEQTLFDAVLDQLDDHVIVVPYDPSHTSARIIDATPYDT